MAHPDLSLRETIALVLVGSLLAGHGLHMLWALVTKPHVHEFFRSVVARTAKALQSISARPAERSDIEKIADAKVETELLNRSGSINRAWSVLCFFVFLAVAVNKIFAEQAQHMDGVGLFFGFGIYASALLSQTRCFASSKVGAHLPVALGFAMIAAAVSPWVMVPEVLELHPEYTAGARMVVVLLNWASTSTKCSCVGTAMCMASLTASMLTHMDAPPTTAVACEAGFGVAVVVSSRSMLVSLCQQIRATAKADAAQAARGAALAILRTFCEIIVDVDAEGRILGDGGDLMGSYLLRGRSLKGARIQDLFLPDDNGGVALLEKLKAPRPEGASLAEASHVRIRDGSGAALPLQLFHFTHDGADGHFVCTVGLRKFTDDPALAQDAMMQEGAGAGGLLAQDCIGKGEACVVVDTAEGYHNLPVEFCSPGFGATVVNLPHAANLAKFLEEPHKFHKWLVHAMNVILTREARAQQAEDEDEDEPVESVGTKREGEGEGQPGSSASERDIAPPTCRVCFRTRDGRVAATATLAGRMRSQDLADEPPSGSAPSDLLARVLFTDASRKFAFGAGNKHGVEDDAQSRRSSRGSRQRGTAPKPAPEASGALSAARGPACAGPRAVTEL